MADGIARHALVIGYGSALRGDDALGRRVAAAIERRAIPDVDVLISTQLLPEFVEPIAAADAVVFVDASLAVDAVTTSRLAAAATKTTNEAAPDSHRSTPTALLDLAASLHDRRPVAHLVEVPAFDLALGERLSQQGADALDEAIDQVLRLLTTLR